MTGGPIVLGVAGAALGATLLAFTMFDVVWTTLGARGGGPLTSWLSSRLWRLALALHRRWPSSRRLAAAGIGIVVAGFGAWTLLLWIGWLLVFLGAPDAVVSSSNGTPADLWERAYFVGYSVITLGIGDFVPGRDAWRVLTVFASGSGFFVLTLSVTYLLSLLPAVVQKRAAADYIAALGVRPAEIVANHRRDGSCEALLEHVPTLMTTLGTLAQQHTAYPILHYFHAGERRSALPLRVAALSEAFLHLDAGAARCEVTAFGVRPLRETLRQLIGTMADLHLVAAADAPPPPPDEPTAGSATGAGASLGDAAREREHYRRLLLRYVTNDGWRWQDVYAEVRENPS